MLYKRINSTQRRQESPPTVIVTVELKECQVAASAARTPSSPEKDGSPHMKSPQISSQTASDAPNYLLVKIPYFFLKVPVRSEHGSHLLGEL